MKCHACSMSLDVLLAICAPDPGFIFYNRTTEVPTVFINLIHSIGFYEVLCYEIGIQVTALQIVVIKISGCLAGPGVSATLRDEVDDNSTGRDSGILTACGDLNFLKRIEVIIRRCCAGSCGIGNIHTIIAPSVLRKGAAASCIDRLLTGLASANVHAIYVDTRRLIQDNPGIAR